MTGISDVVKHCFVMRSRGWGNIIFFYFNRFPQLFHFGVGEASHFCKHS